MFVPIQQENIVLAFEHLLNKNGNVALSKTKDNRNIFIVLKRQ